MEKIREGDRFRSPFTKRVLQVKKTHMNSVVLEEVGNQDCEVITEIETIHRLYKRVEDYFPPVSPDRKISENQRVRDV